MGNYNISICIPAYMRVDYLERLLASIASQTFRDFEVIVADDSTDHSVESLLEQFRDQFPIQYFKNTPPLGTPANWNFAISKASGEWIKLMHDDDWFSSPNSLQEFANKTGQGPKFIFSAYTNVFESGAKQELVTINNRERSKYIVQTPMRLLAHNIIGPPSVTMLHRNLTEKYDERLKWRVDLEFYIRILQNEKAFTYIQQSLVNVGISNSQVTQSCLYIPEVELPEGWILLQKHGLKPLLNIWVYDAWWRLLRNLEIKRVEQLAAYGQDKWPLIITAMVKDLASVPESMLKIGACSKMFMALSFFKNRNKTNG